MHLFACCATYKMPSLRRDWLRSEAEEITGPKRSLSASASQFLARWKLWRQALLSKRLLERQNTDSDCRTSLRRRIKSLFSYMRLTTLRSRGTRLLLGDLNVIHFEELIGGHLIQLITNLTHAVSIGRQLWTHKTRSVNLKGKVG
jgi:hypothetical protein